jgi:hypothetical protein
MKVIGYLFARLAEPSSYAGLGAALALLGINLPDSEIGALIQVLAAVCGFLALLLRDRGIVPALLLTGGLGLTLAACAPADGPAAAVGNAVAAAEIALTDAERLALRYTGLPRCGTAAATALCSDPALVARIKGGRQRGL